MDIIIRSISEFLSLERKLKCGYILTWKCSSVVKCIQHYVCDHRLRAKVVYLSLYLHLLSYILVYCICTRLFDTLYTCFGFMMFWYIAIPYWPTGCTKLFKHWDDYDNDGNSLLHIDTSHASYNSIKYININIIYHY